MSKSKQPVSMTTKRLQSIAKHVATLVKYSKQIDTLCTEARRIDRRHDETYVEADLASEVFDGASFVESARLEIKDAEATFNRAARAYQRVVAQRAKSHR